MRHANGLGRPGSHADGRIPGGRVHRVPAANGLTGSRLGHLGISTGHREGPISVTSATGRSPTELEIPGFASPPRDGFALNDYDLPEQSAAFPACSKTSSETRRTRESSPA